ncbi:polysaccharide deacetylase family protein [Streptomyces sp. RLB3-17]|nr:polysaccharide deacetylase family protein [Streptomyces sp. RLA2-12]QDN63447.1 polysaccharide deacetylase family protein [Streptomyces sp. S1D4-20]QDN73495.1 polysaccharide deacetylase family protein [Streptomyces sp. S1D4-14]QDN83570.1 polysaccharide deacetylase family protein [Streptomyces sp. S1A1-7]QDN93883.1 polysaccharide deacetylase family protein [Streptomyces sp. RLB3-6]QDO04199.1 polysaccharide deacetylase family protein [Streptomyces sp. RLB1-9]QDO14301.1 polysaccharide deacetyl
MYHSIAAAPNDATRELSVGPEAFAEQMALLGDQGFTPVDTAALAARWRSGGPLPERPVLITFDDGYEGVHRHGLPVLAKHGFAATLFVSTGWIKGAYDTGGGLDAMLSWAQVRELAAEQVEIGGHSHTHPQLDQLSDDALRFEVLRCKEIIADELGSRPASFAYPYGYSSRRVRQVVRETGFAQSLAVGNGLARRRQGPYALQRVTVRRGTGIEEFERLVEGRAIARNFVRDRALTKGYAMVRRARQVRRKAIRSRV